MENFTNEEELIAFNTGCSVIKRRCFLVRGCNKKLLESIEQADLMKSSVHCVSVKVIVNEVKYREV